MTTIRIPNLQRGLKAAAIKYAQKSYRVLPLWGITKGRCDCKNPDCPSPGKHPISSLVPHGEKNASSDVSTITKWWRQYPNANIGLLVDGFTVIDVDGETGRKSLGEFGKLPNSTTVKTGRGHHYYYEGTVNAYRKLPGIDIKTKGYVVAPPSNHASGKVYTWEHDLGHMVPLPKAVKALLAKPEDKTHKSATGKKRISQSSRNNTLTSIGGYFRAKGFEQDQIIDILDTVNEVACKPPLPDGEIDRIAASMSRYVPDSEQAFGNMEDVEPRDITFIWEPYLPRGCLITLDGNPGVGKSYLTMEIAAAATGNRRCGTGAKVTDTNVLILAAEDEADCILQPRLKAQRADLSRIRFMTEHFILDDAGVELLRAELTAHPAELVIIDPITAFLAGKVDMYRANEVRMFLIPLMKLAQELGIAILIVRHLRKASADQAIHSGMGSMDFIAAARSGLLVVHDPEDPTQRILAHAKHNYSEPGPSLVYKLVPTSAGNPPKLTWQGTSPLNADQLISGSSAATKQDEAEDFLKDILANGKIPSKTVLQRAKDRGISKRTLERVKAKLGVECSTGPGAKWWLP